MKRRQKALAISNLEVRVLLPKVMGRFAGGLIFFPVSWPRMIQKRLDGSFGLAWVMWRSQVVRRAESSSTWIWLFRALISGLVRSSSWIWSLVSMRDMASWDKFGIKVWYAASGDENF